MTIEDQLKQLILSKHKSLREFCLDIGLAYSTVDSILRRGIENAGIGKIIKICRYFNISADALAAGKIKFNKDIDIIPEFSFEEKNLIKKYRALDERGRKTIDALLNYEYSLKNYIQEGEEILSDKDIDNEVENYRLELVAERGGDKFNKAPKEPAKKA